MQILHADDLSAQLLFFCNRCENLSDMLCASKNEKKSWKENTSAHNGNE